MMTTGKMVAIQLAEVIERECGRLEDEPEGTRFVTMSVTFAREVAKVLRRDD